MCILLAQCQGLRSCYCLPVILDQTTGEQISLQRVHGSRTAWIDLHKGLPAIVENRVAQLRDLVDAAAAQVRIHTRQHADRKLARAWGEAAVGEPIVKTVGDWPQQWQ